MEYEYRICSMSKEPRWIVRLPRKGWAENFNWDTGEWFKSDFAMEVFLGDWNSQPISEKEAFEYIKKFVQ